MKNTQKDFIEGIGNTPLIKINNKPFIEYLIMHGLVEVDFFDEVLYGEGVKKSVEEKELEEEVSISMQSSLVADTDDDAEDWADELDSEYNE